MILKQQSLTQNSSLPLVSVCIPTRNGAEYLKEALNSIVVQEYLNIEVVVSDDRSTDNTLEIIEKFKSKVDLPVFIYDHKPAGIGANWNNCIKNANGEYIKFLFQDDVLYPACIEEMVQEMNKDPNIGLVASKRRILINKPSREQLEWISNYGDLQKELNFVSNETIVIDSRFLKREDLLAHPTNKIGEPSAVLFRRSILKKTGWFNENLSQDLDYEFYFRVLKRFKISIIKKELVGFRLHPGQATNINRERSINDKQELDRILIKELFWFLNKYQQKRLLLKFFPRLRRLIKVLW